jgi:hypothetical protein
MFKFKIKKFIEFLKTKFILNIFSFKNTVSSFIWFNNLLILKDINILIRTMKKELFVGRLCLKFKLSN